MSLTSRLPAPMRDAIRKARVELDRVVQPWLLERADPAHAHDRSNAATVAGFHAASLGLGRAATLCALELEASGLVVSRLDASSTIETAVDRAVEDGGDLYAGALVLQINPDVLAHVLRRLPRTLLRNRRVVGYWVHELSEAPQDWQRLNHVVHEVWAPSRFAADALAKRLKRAVEVVPHPVALDLRSVPDGAALRAKLSIAPEHFVAFTTFSARSSIARKNPYGAIRAFRDAFGGRRDARLVLRCLHGTEAVMGPLRAAVAEARGAVTLLERNGAEPGGLDEVAQLYGACDVYLSLHRSEGFGLTIAEAMGAGRAVIATGWSGNLDFMNDEVSKLIPTRPMPVVDPQGLYKGSWWAEPDHDASVAALRTLKDNSALRSRLGRAAAAHVRKVLSGGRAAALLR